MSNTTWTGSFNQLGLLEGFYSSTAKTKMAEGITHRISTKKHTAWLHKYIPVWLPSLLHCITTSNLLTKVLLSLIFLLMFTDGLNKVLTAENKVQMFGHNTNTGYQNQHLLLTVKQRGEGVMIWACFKDSYRY